MDSMSWEKVSQALASLPSAPSGIVKVRGQDLPVDIGVVAGIDPAGIGIIVDIERREHAFKFAALAHYRGQSAATLGLEVGQQVKFVLLDEKVALVEPYTQSSTTSSIAPKRIQTSRS